MIDTIRQDLRYALRMLRGSPGFAAAAIVTLALGVGANTAIFSLIQAVLLRPLPVSAPEELYFVAIEFPGRNGIQMSTASNYPWLERVRQRGDVFAGVTAFNIRDFKVASPDGVERVPGQYVSGNFHAVAAVPMALGRGFTAEDDRSPGSSPFAVISDGYWSRRFGRDPQVLGRTLVVGGRPVTVVGVTARGFDGMQPGRSVDITLPLSIRIADEPDFLSWYDSWTSMPIVTRRRPGIDVTQAEAVVRSIFREHMSLPETRFFSRLPTGAPRQAGLVSAERGHERLRSEFRTALTVLLGMVSLVLLIACVNVANLLLVRGAARAGEVAVRMSVGASRPRLVRQFLTESILLGVAGGAVGLILAGWGTRFVAALLRESQNPIVIDAQPDTRVLLFAAGLTLVTGLASGLVPAFNTTRIHVTPSLRAGAATVVAGRGTGGRRVLVAAQIALCLVLVFGAALLVRTLRNLQHVDGGFETADILVLALDARDTTFPAGRVVALCGDILDRLRRRPGVDSASCSTMSPIDTAIEGRLLGIPAPPPGTPPGEVFANTVTPDYFQTFGIGLVRGRLFTPQDSATSARVAVINESVVRAHFGDADPVGRVVGFGSQPDPARTLTVVGVVRDARHSLREAPPPMVYQPLSQILEPPEDLTVAVHTTGDPATLAGQVRGEVSALTRDVAVTWVRTMEEQIEAALTSERLLATLATAFGALALLLACVGLYGVMAYDVASRQRDIGIRLALGASPAEVRATVLRTVAAIAVGGLATGLVAAWFASQLVARFLFGLTPRDPNTLGATALVLAVTAMLAGYVPARRASRVDPAVALRAE